MVLASSTVDRGLEHWSGRLECGRSWVRALVRLPRVWSVKPKTIQLVFAATPQQRNIKDRLALNKEARFVSIIMNGLFLL